MVFPLNLALNATNEVKSLADFPNFNFFMTARAMSGEPLFDFLPLDTEGVACDDGSKTAATSKSVLCCSTSMIMVVTVILMLTMRMCC